MLWTLCDTTEECRKQHIFVIVNISTVNLNTFIYVTPHVQRTVKKCVLREHTDLHLKL